MELLASVMACTGFGIEGNHILACMTLAAMRVGLCTAISTSPQWLAFFLLPPSDLSSDHTRAH